MNLGYKDIARLRASGIQVVRKNGTPVSPPEPKVTDLQRLRRIEEMLSKEKDKPVPKIEVYPKVEVYPKITVESPTINVPESNPVVTFSPVKKWRFDFVRDGFGRLKTVTATAID